MLSLVNDVKHPSLYSHAGVQVRKWPPSDAMVVSYVMIDNLSKSLFQAIADNIFSAKILQFFNALST